MWTICTSPIIFSTVFMVFKGILSIEQNMSHDNTTDFGASPSGLVHFTWLILHPYELSLLCLKRKPSKQFVIKAHAPGGYLLVNPG